MDPPTTVTLGAAHLQPRRATDEDLPALVALLADDPLGADREGGDLAPCRRAFDLVDADPAHCCRPPDPPRLGA